jgi:uncharacterized protein (DUF1778 family)
MKTIEREQSRFDTRLSKEQKHLFERAAMIGGYRNLTDFVIATVQNKAKEIIEERERIIVTQRDQAVFFETLSSPPRPNKKLLSAKKAYTKLLGK